MSSLSDIEGEESATEHWQDSVLAALSWAAWIDLVERSTFGFLFATGYSLFARRRRTTSVGNQAATGAE